MSERALVIGLDGFTFQVVDRLVAEGRMPVLERLMREGVRAPLESTVMPNSFPGWTSCTTGCNEGQHGIFMPLVRRADNFSMKAMDSTDVRRKTVWEILSDRGRRSIVVNDPCSYPPQHIDGWVVSGMTTPDAGVAWTHPAQLKAELLAEAPDYIVDVNLFGQTRGAILDELFESVDARLRAARWLLGTRDWDLAWITFTESDRVQHRFWADQQPDHPRHKPEFPTAVDEMYVRLDAAVGELVEAIPDGTRVFLVSDHGFAPYYCSFDVTGWLIANGFTAQRAGKSGMKKALASVGLLDEAVSVYRRFRRAVESEARHGVDRMRDVEDEAATGKSYADVDWSQTRAYATLDGGIRINVRGREPHGVVDRAYADRLAAEIRDRLAAERFPNGEPVFESVMLASDCFTGPYADRGPDIVIPPRTDAYSGSVASHRFLTDRHRNSGEHARYGVFVAWGRGVVPGARVASARLIDVAPTVLSSLGEPPTVEMDGRTLEEIFDAGVRSKLPAGPRGSSVKDEPGDGEGLSEDEEALVEERLRGLGYIE
ncbi:MAG: alkaline phosphatase family protein [Acidobacteria bacterium]|nr:alkaline phosphatase family protein [Acidobacteriota bacterium]